MKSSKVVNCSVSFFKIFILIIISLMILNMIMNKKMENQLLVLEKKKTQTEYKTVMFQVHKNRKEKGIRESNGEETDNSPIMIDLDQGIGSKNITYNKFAANTGETGQSVEEANNVENVHDPEMDLKTNWTFKYISIEEGFKYETKPLFCGWGEYEMLIYDQVRHMLDKRSRETLSNDDPDALINFKEYGYSIQWSVQNNYDVVIVMEETYLGVLTNGGSSFRITVQGDHNFLCNIKDNFNGTYHICCPKVPPCSRLEIIQMYTNFGAFNEITPLYPSLGIIANITLHNCEIPQDLQLFNEFMNETIRCNDNPSFISQNGRWIKVNETYKWGLHKECLLHFISELEANHCLKSVNSIMCSGQSHLRNAMMYFSFLAGGKFPSEKFKDWGFEHFKFLWTPRTKNIQNDITVYINETYFHRNRNDVVIIEGGPWDLRNLPLLEYWNIVKDLVVPAIKSMRQSTSSCRDVTFIWLNNVAFPHKPSFLFREYHKRSDFRAAAVNGLIYDLTRDLGINIIDHLMATSPRSTLNVCGHHYLCPTDFNNPTEIVGDVGMTVAQMLFQQMCQPYLRDEVKMPI